MIDYIFGFFACMIYLKSFCTIILYFNLKFRWRGLFALTRLAVRLGLVRSGQVCGQRRSSASPRPPCDGTPSASFWPSPRQTPDLITPVSISSLGHSIDWSVFGRASDFRTRLSSRGGIYSGRQSAQMKYRTRWTVGLDFENCEDI